ncbi:hypothetical protein HMPREF1544_10305 [Mucor circinelloides 1006PhL]|uniref:Uncharacterized protein n=1 Tax=Mucor circinelloides f. circinelloides (strain 1006PhL) TaxID=1220926 RepID=S2JT52_MUCC1|nr:hypothetical protein HMPREF1544_10305 [Mucor circinelloides 1006PhL]
MHPGCCDDEDIAEKYGKRSFEVPAAKANLTGAVVVVGCEIRNAMLLNYPSPHGDAMEVDQSPISSLLPSRNVPAGDVDFQGRIDRLKLSLDNMLAESGFISDSLLVEQDEQAREKAIIRLAQLYPAVQIYPTCWSA